jgi:hypothetical protein
MGSKREKNFIAMNLKNKLLKNISHSPALSVFICAHLRLNNKASFDNVFAPQFKSPFNACISAVHKDIHTNIGLHLMAGL